ncbi:MAG: TonB family protein [Burkholderiales bacterium]|nr:TonB family protein [Burkholderiales bacterium]
MNLFSVQPERGLPEEIKRRLTAGLIVSLLLHAFVLSLQFGLPGLGLPALEAPWNKRRAQIPDISIRIANLPAAPVLGAAAPPAEPVLPASVAQARVVPEGIRLLAPQPKPAVAKSDAVVGIKKIPGKQLAGAPAAAPRVRQQAAPDVPRIIAQDRARDDSFVMPVPDPDEPLKKTEEETAQAKDEIAQAGVDPEAGQKKIEAAAAEQQKRQQQLEQQQRRQDEELARQQALEMAAQQQQLTRQLEQDSRKQADQALRRQAAALALQQQQEAQQQQRRLEQEAARSEALRLDEQKRLEDERRLQEQRKEQLQREQLQKEQAQQEQLRKEQQLALEQERRRQAQERTEENARQQALQRLEQQAAQARAEAVAARQKAEDLAARQRAEQVAAQQRARDLAQAQAQAAMASANAAAAAEANQGGHAGAGEKTGGFVLPKSLLSSELASHAQQQARGMDLLRGTPPRAEVEQTPRRRSILGSLDKDVPLRMYVDSWKQKIERNGNLNYSQLAKDRARGDPLVTVALRSDGSVEEIIINRSSGRADLDEAVRRIVRLNAKYAAFPPNVAAQYDVIEIRRVWNFDEVLRIVEELR